MDIQQNKTASEKDEQVQKFFSKEEQPEAKQPEPERPRHLKNALAHWQAPEFEVFERDKKWYLYASLALVAIIGYALYTNSPIMAVTFILIGVLEYIYLNKEPRILDFAITMDGIIVGNEIYEFENIHAFWIFYEPPHTKILSLHTTSKLTPYLHLPIEEESPVRIREILIKHIPETKQDFRLVDALERIFRL
jgi:hypothetical protein